MAPCPSERKHEQIEKLKANLDAMKILPVPHIMRAYRQRLAELTMETDMSEGIYHLTESHGISLRIMLESSWRLNPAAATDGRLDLMHCIQFGGYDSVDGMTDRLRSLPSEWTLVQLSGGVETETESEGAWLSVLPTGAEAGLRAGAARRLAPPPPGLFQRMRDAAADSGNVRSRPGAPSFSDRLQELVTDMKEWLGPWIFLLSGRLEDRCLGESVQTTVDRALPNLDPASRTIAARLAEVSPLLDTGELSAALDTLGISPSDWPEFPAEVSPSAPRQTLVILLDQALDMFPWEGLPLLKDQPVTRMESLHLLHMLHEGHSDRMVGGALLLPSPVIGHACLASSGVGSTTGGAELHRMREMLTRFFASRLPQWVVAGDDPGPASFLDGLDKDVFLYAGHGSGSQLARLEKVQEQRVSAVVFLMGCESGKFGHYGGKALYWGTPHAYLIAASPCTVGSLWSVADRPTNELTVTLLHHWLPLAGASASLDDHAPPASRPRPTHRPQPALLRALATARGESVDFSVRLAVVARGLPVASES